MDFTPQVETAEIADADLDNVSGGLAALGVADGVVGTATGLVGTATGTVGGLANVSQVTGTVSQLTGLDTSAVSGVTSVAGL